MCTIISIFIDICWQDLLAGLPSTYACGRIAGREVLLMVEKGWVKDYLGTLNIHQFIGQDGMLAGVMERVLSIILERL